MIPFRRPTIFRSLLALALLGLLALVIYPWPWFYGDQKEEARAVACLSNMKQVGTALMIYASDADERLPVAPSARGLTMLGWAGRTLPYARDASLFCDPRRTGGSRAPIDYAINANAASLPDLSTAGAPARSVLLFEVADARLGGGSELGDASRLSPEGDGAADGLLNSSVKSMVPHEVSAGTNARISSDGAFREGGFRADLHGRNRPRAEGTERNAIQATFSLR